jgi:3-deoxy-D-arabino-heptulosonate 7-phosphate (DAHP) synthase
MSSALSVSVTAKAMTTLRIVLVINTAITASGPGLFVSRGENGALPVLMRTLDQRAHLLQHFQGCAPAD